MSLKHNVPNPLNFFKLRKVFYCPPHFTKINIETLNIHEIQKVVAWIAFNLNNRYYIGPNIMKNRNNAIIYGITIGFESEKDATFFSIACPIIK